MLLTNGKKSFVDDEDFERLSKFRWHEHSRGYGIRNFGKYGSRLLHSEIVGQIDGLDVDHIDDDKLNNQKDNLRFITHQENVFRKQKQRNASSKFRGVSFEKASNIWKANIKKDSVPYYLGRFSKKEEAAKAYDAKAKELFGEFARLNFTE